MVELGERRGGELVSVLGSTLVSQWREEWGKGGGERVVYSLLTQRHLLLQLCCYGGVGIRCMRQVVMTDTRDKQFEHSLQVAGRWRGVC